LLHSKRVEYLIVGGYAVGYYGHPRATGDMDLWVGTDPGNVERLMDALAEFAFVVPEEERALFLTQRRILRLGVPPLRIEVLSFISGVDFRECYAARETARTDEVEAHFISLRHLRANKRAAGRLKDLSDLAQLPED